MKNVQGFAPPDFSRKRPNEIHEEFYQKSRPCRIAASDGKDRPRLTIIER
jgi:hypothetical protein